MMAAHFAFGQVGDVAVLLREVGVHWGDVRVIP
jgi:hypothetical protein